MIWVFLTFLGILAYIIPGIIVIVGRYMYLSNQHSQAMARYESDMRQYRERIPKWSKLYFCHRDNVVFMAGDGRGAVVPGRMNTLIDSPPTPPRVLPAESSRPAQLPSPKQVEIYHVMLEEVGDMPEAVIGVIATLTGRSKEETAAIVGKAPTRIAKLETQADADKLCEMLGAVGAEANITRQTMTIAPSAGQSTVGVVDPLTVSSGTLTVTVDKTFVYFSPSTDSIKNKTLVKGDTVKIRGTNLEGWFSIHSGYVIATDVSYTPEETV